MAINIDEEIGRREVSKPALRDALKGEFSGRMPTLRELYALHPGQLLDYGGIGPHALEGLNEDLRRQGLPAFYKRTKSENLLLELMLRAEKDDVVVRFDDNVKAATRAFYEILSKLNSFRDGHFDLVAHLARQREFSLKTFGPGPRTKGVVDHIRKELAEIEADPADIMEWVDVVILAFDGAWRAGWEPQAIVNAIVAKQTKNEARQWPDWQTADPDKAIEHVRRPASEGDRFIGMTLGEVAEQMQREA